RIATLDPSIKLRAHADTIRCILLRHLEPLARSTGRSANQLRQLCIHDVSSPLSPLRTLGRPQPELEPPHRPFTTRPPDKLHAATRLQHHSPTPHTYAITSNTAHTAPPPACPIPRINHCKLADDTARTRANVWPRAWA